MDPFDIIPPPKKKKKLKISNTCVFITSFATLIAASNFGWNEWLGFASLMIEPRKLGTAQALRLDLDEKQMLGWKQMSSSRTSLRTEPAEC